jgi:hypothetical protein
MKSFAIIAASAVLAGLAVYFALDALQLLALLQDRLLLQIGTFVGTLAAVGFGSAGLALMFRRGFARADEKVIRRLEERLAKLEVGRADEPAARETA